MCKFEINDKEISIYMKDNLLSNEKDYIYEIKEFKGLSLMKIIYKGIGEYSGEKSILIDFQKNNKKNN